MSLLAAVGMSLAYIPATMTGMGGAAPQDTGLASGLINTTYQVGSALGPAVIVSLAASTGGGGEGVASLLAGYQAAFFGAAALAAIAALAALVLIRGQMAATDVPVG